MSPAPSFRLSPAEPGRQQRSLGRLINKHLPCVKTVTSGPRGASGDTAPASGWGAKSIPATSRAAGLHHLPAKQHRGEEQPKPWGGIWLFS